MSTKFSERDQIVEILNRLFLYTDSREWRKLIDMVFSHNVWLDMTSLGGTAEEVTSAQICNMWEEGFKDLDAIHHQAGTYSIDLNDDAASATGYSIASHYKKSASNGNKREFIGSYDFELEKTSIGWRINKMKYNLKYITGNIDLT